MAKFQSPESDLRPSPDALLAVAKAEARGKLKIFLGAAPGVGKTYEMLDAARRKRAEGVDVVVGVVETHGRKETEALLAGHEIIPRRIVEYKGRTLQEMDIDAILKRRPQLVLVDELAHTNAPGSRHPKRYLDIEELLEAGVDVYSTLNIQHLESLNDVVARITRIRVRETIPDSVVSLASEVELVDLTPEELIQRLREGKVYVKDQADRAIKHYFSPGNLTALRELALRRTAERVDAEMLGYMQAHGIAGPWPASERILVCIGDSDGAGNLLRYAKRLADRLHAPWTAAHVETASQEGQGEAARARVADMLRLAARLGAETISLPGHNVADAILGYAREHNISEIVVGRSRKPRWLRRMIGSTAADVVTHAGTIAVHVLGTESDAAPAKTVTAAPAAAFDFMPYVIGALLVAAANLFALGVDWFVEVPNISLVFITAVMVSAMWHGILPSLFAALLSALAYNFFFLEPRFTFIIGDPANLLAFFFFALTALLTSGLASRVRQQTLSARRRARTAGDLYSFSGKLAGIAKLDDLYWAAAAQVATMLKVEVVFLAPDGDRLFVAGAFPPEDTLDDADLAAARWCYEHDQAAGRGADTLPGAKRLFLPMRTGRGKVGVVGITRDVGGSMLSPDERRLLDALIDQTAIAIERIRLAEDIDEARIAAERERLRNALLTSISHDLRTPLATIMGAITSLRSYGARYDDKARDEILAGAEEETERLNRFVANLLDMTRVDSGALKPKLEPVDISDIVGSALQRVKKLLAQHTIDVSIEPNLPMLKLDFLLTEQILVNLLDNAGKYAPTGSRIDLSARRESGGIVIQVADRGPGIPPASLDLIFDKFYRVQAADRQRAGTGLGLAICRGFAEAMGGRIEAQNRADGGTGAVFTLRFPDSAIAKMDTFEPAPAAP